MCAPGSLNDVVSRALVTNITVQARELTQDHAGSDGRDAGGTAVAAAYVTLGRLCRVASAASGCAIVTALPHPSRLRCKAAILIAPLSYAPWYATRPSSCKYSEYMLPGQAPCTSRPRSCELANGPNAIGRRHPSKPAPTVMSLNIHPVGLLAQRVGTARTRYSIHTVDTHTAGHQALRRVSVRIWPICVRATWTGFFFALSPARRV